MQAGKAADKLLIFGAILCLTATPAFAAKHAVHTASDAVHSTAHTVASRSHGVLRHGSAHAEARAGRRSEHSRRIARYASAGGGYMNCVAFAREETGMDISGNANQWWNHAAGLYERGNRPEVGAIMSFTANGRMPSGHVAVVADVVNSRVVEIDQANWWGPGGGRGRISRGIPVIDVSPDNDWTAVRVGLGKSGDYGSIYPTDGFIYDRADAGRNLPPHPTNASLPAVNPAPADLRSRAEREAAANEINNYDEVAEAPAPKSR